MARIDLELNRAIAEIDALIATVPDLADDPDLRFDMIDGQTDAADLLRKIVSLHIETKAMATALKGVEAEYKARRERVEARSQGFKDMAERIMQAAHLGKLVLPEATLSVRQVPPAVIVTDEASIPARYIRVKHEIDRVALKEALKSGESVPGATLGNGGETLAILTR